MDKKYLTKLCLNYPEAGLENTLLPESITQQNPKLPVSERFLSGLLKSGSAPSIVESTNTVAYHSDTDTILIPNMESFRSSPSYYRSLLHELSHASGHRSRLNRPSLNSESDMTNMDWLQGKYSNDYIQEELTAEVSCFLLAKRLGITSTKRHSLRYCRYFIDLIEKTECEKIVSRAVDAGIEAAEYLLGLAK